MKENKDLHSFDELLDEYYGKPGEKTRDELDAKAQAFSVGQMLHDARKQERITQSELAKRIGSNKSYISKIENGYVEPSASLFIKIISALGLRIEVSRPLYSI